MSDPIEIARQSYLAFANSNRAKIEGLLADDFHFTSPLDNRIDRQTFFERCWPNNEAITGFEFVRLVRNGDEVIVTYEGESSTGSRFRNTEVLTIRNGKITEAEVYFGWNVPHDAAAGGFLDPSES